MEFGSGWSLATDGVWQRMEFGNGWSLATDGVRNDKFKSPCLPNAPCPMPNAQFPIPNSQRSRYRFIQHASC
jgi:hypothetical protein